MSNAWHQDVATEQMLKDIGIRFVLRKAIPIKQLKIKDSLNNNARMADALCGDQVEMYSYYMSRGFSFPAIVLKSDYLILAGNQRRAAAQEAGRTTIDAYVIDPSTPQAKLDDFVRRDNIKHGIPLTEEEKIQTCVWLSQEHGTPLKDLCAKYFGNNSNVYQRIVSASEAHAVVKRLKTLGVTMPSLPQATLVNMHSVKDDDVLRNLYFLARDFALPSTEVDRISDQISSKGSEAERLAVISGKKTEMTKQAKTGVVQIDALLLKRISSVLGFLESGYHGKPFPPIEKITMDKSRRRELQGVIEEAITRLKSLKEKVK
jgi:hypothetical protein